MKQRSLILIAVVALIGIAVSPSAQEKSPPRLVFSGETENGKVWANVGLTRQRLDEDYLPMVVMVVNQTDSPVVLDRDSFRLVAGDGVRYPMPTLKELRKGYDRIAQDARRASAAGLPWEVWRRDRKMAQSSFFPDISFNRRALVIEEVTLAPRHGMIDLLYFAKPTGFVAGQPFLLEIQAIGWDTPIRMGMVLTEVSKK